MMDSLTSYIDLVESKQSKQLTQNQLRYSRDGLEPCLSKETIDLHYGKLYKGYVERFNKGEGDAEFNEAGAFLHGLYFEQFTPPKGSNKPTGPTADFIDNHFKTWDNFTAGFEKEAMSLEGSGWIYLSTSGSIKTIHNHQIKRDIVLIIDWWEHSFLIDYGSDKKSYLRNQWKIVDWTIINARISPNI